eukprot:scaffold14923_cov119-Skeletonema_marinoi.AAC.1
MKLLKLEEAYGFELFHFFARTRKIRHAVRTSASGRKQGIGGLLTAILSVLGHLYQSHGGL